jgi:hypothetical protein
LNAQKGIIAAQTLGSPASIKMPPGMFVMWAGSDGDPGTPKTEKIRVEIRGEESKSFVLHIR